MYSIMLNSKNTPAISGIKSIVMAGENEGDSKMRKLIGREKEQDRLQLHYNSNRSEFVALFGRRRVGKTFLIKSLFESEFTFYATGAQNITSAEQIERFNKEIRVYGGSELEKATSWFEAFENLNSIIMQSKSVGKKVIFLDEISWMGGTDTSFISALDYFWNRWISFRDDVLLIICGSGTSWIIDNIVNNTGGLHNRLTDQILLMPFTLGECEEYFLERGIRLARYQIVEAYMIFGGIPHYLDFFLRDKSLAQNVDRIYFAPDAPLMNEYSNLYDSLFKNAEDYIKIIEAISTKRKGLYREEIAALTKMKSGGTLTKMIKDLIVCGFIRDYIAFGKKRRDVMYQVIDPFTYFHLCFRDKQKSVGDNYWQYFSSSPAHSAWSGYAFELVSLLHIGEIKKSLGISGVLTSASSWRSKTSEPGAQIDLVLERNDGIIHLCEMKYSTTEYVIDKEYSAKLREKRGAFIYETATKKAAHTTLVTSYGLKRNEYSSEILFQITMDDFF